MILNLFFTFQKPSYRIPFVFKTTTPTAIKISSVKGGWGKNENKPAQRPPVGKQKVFLPEALLTNGNYYSEKQCSLSKITSGKRFSFREVISLTRVVEEWSKSSPA